MNECIYKYYSHVFIYYIFRSGSEFLVLFTGKLHGDFENKNK